TETESVSFVFGEAWSIDAESTTGATFAVEFATAWAPKLAVGFATTSCTHGAEPGFVYATVTVSLWLTAVASVSVTLLPEIDGVPVSACATPFFFTVKIELATVCPSSSGFENTTSSDVPSTVADENEGGVVSTTNERVAEYEDALLELSVAFARQ